AIVVRALQHASPAQSFGISLTARVLKPSNRKLILSGFYGATPGTLIANEAGAVIALPPLTQLLAHGGPVVACAPGVAKDLSFLMEPEKQSFAAA
ncbi:hypothetical protein JNB91_30190, partial [Rhizobium wenxiniae]|nr:hypothetical protein [Rhizobium wenxiniae]